MPRFRGCKLALVHEERVLVYTRDDRPDLVFPGMIDFPGGGREGNETPEQCVLRELHEEFGILLPKTRLEYRRRYPIPHLDGHAYFFAGKLHAAEIDGIRFGSEGTQWQLMRIGEFLQHPNGVPHLKARFADYLEDSESP